MKFHLFGACAWAPRFAGARRRSKRRPRPKRRRPGLGANGVVCPTGVFARHQPYVRFRRASRASTCARRSSKAVPGTTIGRSFNYVGWSVAQLPVTADYNALATLRKALGTGNVEVVVKRYATRIPNDPQFGQQYWLNTIGAPSAWNITTGSSNIIVAVIDSGVQLSHPICATTLQN
jgi:thermitase